MYNGSRRVRCTGEKHSSEPFPAPPPVGGVMLTKITFENETASQPLNATAQSALASSTYVVLVQRTVYHRPGRSLRLLLLIFRVKSPSRTQRQPLTTERGKGRERCLLLAL